MAKKRSTRKNPKPFYCTTKNKEAGIEKNKNQKKMGEKFLGEVNRPVRPGYRGGDAHICKIHTLKDLQE